ncbi:MYXO-CTERM sorting domain-containing protein [Pseudomonadota bacterium]
MIWNCSASGIPSAPILLPWMVWRFSPGSNVWLLFQTTM